MGLFGEFSRIEDSILIFWKVPVLACNHLIDRSDASAPEKAFKNWGLNPQFLKTPQKAPWDWTKCLPSAPKMIFLGPNNFFCATEIWAMCFLQKTAPDLVKYGLHSLAYNLPPHIGGRHSVLYFTIQATKKYSNSNVLHHHHRVHRVNFLSRGRTCGLNTFLLTLPFVESVTDTRL